jgi:hypothetical protein
MRNHTVENEQGAHSERGEKRGVRISCRPPERDERQMTMIGNERDRQGQANPRLPLDEHLRLCRRRATWPGNARLKTGRPASGTAAKVDFIRRGALQAVVRPVVVIPVCEQVQLALKRAAQHGNNGEQPRTPGFQSLDEALDDRNAAWPADGTATLADAVLTTPDFEVLGGKLHAAVSDQILGRIAGCLDGAGEKPGNFLGCGLRGERSSTQNAAGIVVEDLEEGRLNNAGPLIG